MKLTESQIQDLYTFTRQHFVEHYDLQTELVDHLANDIEQQWQNQPKLSFEDAKNKAFKKFGIFGFMDAIEQKQKAMNKRYMKYLWSELKTWFQLPQLLTTITLFLMFYIAFSSNFAIISAIGLYFFIAIWTIYKSFQLKRHFKIRKEISDKKWMLEEMIYKQAGGSALLLLSQLPTWFNFSENYFNNFYFVLVFSVFSSVFVIWMYISFEIIPNKAEKLLNETYPEFSL